MGEKTGIEWTDHTFNPWIGCTKVSAGCDNCYAEQLMDKRWGKVNWGKGNPRARTSVKNWNDPIRWDRAAGIAGRRDKVFCASLADIFDNEVPDEWRRDLFRVIEKTPNLDWLLLTKRPAKMKSWMEATGYDGILPNVWLGVSVEDQKTAELRIPILLSIHAAKRWISYEPALSGIDFQKWFFVGDEGGAEYAGSRSQLLDWVIVGGESTQSGPARPFDVAWALSTVNQCREAGVACFVKQLGSNPNRGPLPAPVLKDPKGKDPEEWPKEIRVREFP